MIQRILFLFILSASMTASHASAIDYIQKENNLRCDKYKIANEQNACEEHTTRINRILSNEKIVNSTRHATVDEAKMMLKSVMGTAIIHQYTLYPQASSPFNKRSKLTPSTLLSKHFEILALAEEYANEQYRFLASNACTLILNAENKKLKNISLYTGIAEKTLTDWFLETCRDHGMEIILNEDYEAPIPYQTSATAPLATKQITATAAPLFFFPERSLFRSDIQNLKGRYDPHFRSALFGTIDEHSLTCYRHAFISTYNLELQTSFIDHGLTKIGSRYTTIARLPDINGRQKFIVFQYPYNNNNTAYTVRAHAILQPDANRQTNRNVNASITIGNQTSSNANIGINGDSRGVHIHDGTFSPNNMHLSGLPNRSLREGEIFSFSSHVNGDNGINVDTFHMLLGGNAAALVTKLATEFLRISMHEKVYYDQSLFDKYKDPIQEFKGNTSSRGFGTFIEMLESTEIKEKLMNDTKLTNFSEHIGKLITFMQQDT